eukprot:TRINITY_DN1465_c0_g1_i5.p2 TRINITY_DN1465_c0_g1~~TRINITY_DN1465_c0_g1_i5.p2  ORF type:complete len:129 (+),score=26.83 TRINITY_DN1465_c0_g1_i5:1084-1470(+)
MKIVYCYLISLLFFNLLSASKMVAGVNVISGAHGIHFEGNTYRVLDTEGIVKLQLEAGFFHHHHQELTFELVGFANSLQGVQFTDGTDLTGYYTFNHHHNVGSVRFSPAGVAILNAGGTITFIDYFRG